LFSRGAPAGFVIRTGAVIPGFDRTLIGKQLGTRMLLSIPPADGYGSSATPRRAYPAPTPSCSWSPTRRLQTERLGTGGHRQPAARHRLAEGHQHAGLLP
jgi:hypothetical protein